jgi:murein DD-endopeptidase MepM/ murein hydrolase activator NlpD
MTDYADYVRNTVLPQNDARLQAGASLTEDLLQAMKNRSAPRVSGSGSTGSGGGGGIGSASYTGPLKLPKMGGKVLPTGARISQGWGKSNIHYAAGRHTGMDFGGASGSRINAAAGGVVTRTGSDGAYGNAIHIRHKDGTTALYGHLSGVNVKAGQTVKAGQSIGKMGATGRAFGTHLHFEIRKQDRYGADINPRSWFATR